MGLIGISCYHVALNAGERTVSAGSASLIASLNPIFTSLIASAWQGDRLPYRAWAGVLIGFAGAVLVAMGEGGVLQLDPGAGLVLASALFQAIYFVMQKPYFQHYRPFEITAYVVWSGDALSRDLRSRRLGIAGDDLTPGQPCRRLSRHRPRRHWIRDLVVRALPDAGGSGDELSVPGPAARSGDRLGRTG